MQQELIQSIEDSAKAITDDIHTAMPGMIASFDSGSGMATVQPNGKYKTSDGKSIAYPAISKCPVVFPFCQSIGVGMAFPVKAGDSCLLIVSEVEMDEWRTGAESEGALKFDLTNCICIPGLLEGGSALAAKANAENAAVIGAGGTEVVISSSGVAIKGDLTVEGTITSSNDVKARGTSLKEHTHKSASPGSSSGKPE